MPSLAVADRRSDDSHAIDCYQPHPRTSDGHAMMGLLADGERFAALGILRRPNGLGPSVIHLHVRRATTNITMRSSAATTFRPIHCG